MMILTYLLDMTLFYVLFLNFELLSELFFLINLKLKVLLSKNLDQPATFSKVMSFVWCDLLLPHTSDTMCPLPPTPLGQGQPLFWSPWISFPGCDRPVNGLLPLASLRHQRPYQASARTCCILFVQPPVATLLERFPFWVYDE